ncbi:MAG: serine/threonine protein kinase [Elusimicrobia bacterium]|nr:serine/threonine protein kinase [Elusimicrobiota bacterium]
MTRIDFRVTAFALAAALAAGQGFAAPIVKTELEKDQVSLDETVVLAVTAPADCEVEHPSSDRFDVVSFDAQLLGQGESAKKLQPLKNKYSRATALPILGSGAGKQWQRRHTFELHPVFVGPIKIPALAVTCPEGKGKTASKNLIGLASAKSGDKQASSEDGDSILYKPVSLDGTDFKKRDPSPAPPAPGPIARHEIPPPPQVTAPPPPPQAAPAPPPAAADRPAAPAPEAVAAKKYLATAGRTIASILKTVFLALVALIGAAATVWGAYLGAKAYRKTRHYERLRLWVLSMVAPPQKEGNLIGGKYRSLTELGEGGMGTVLLAEDIKLGRKVALKRLHADARFDFKLREKLVDEAQIISQLNHPYIVGIHEVLEADDDIYLVFDFVEGRPLSHILHERKRLTLKECVDIFSNVCQAIDYAHKKNVLHLDIKPSNIMVDANGFAKVMDFGLARREAKEDSFSGVGGSGTFWYMAPEQHSGVTSPAADVYAIAVTIFETLTGDIPFKGPDFVRQKDHLLYIPATTLVPELPAEVDGLFADAFNPKMTQRLPGALQLLEKLKALPSAGLPLARLPMAPAPDPPAAKPAKQ